VLLPLFFVGHSHPPLRKMFDNFISPEINSGIYIRDSTQSFYYLLRFIGFLGDSPARNLFNNISIAGFFGCDCCKQKGENYENAIIYSLNNTDENYQLRDFSAIESLHYNLDVCLCTPVEILHCLYEGLLKKLLSQFHENEIQEIQNKITKLPDIFHRQIDMRDSLKGIQIAALFHIFHEEIAESLVDSQRKATIHKLASVLDKTSKPLSISEINTLKIQLFVLLREIENNFGKEVMTLSSHLVLHIGHYIQYFGPIYLVSTFFMEKSIGDIVKRVTATYRNEYTSLRNFKALQLLRMHQYNNAEVASKRRMPIGNGK
jgi:flagellin-specific chaperone FliS